MHSNFTKASFSWGGGGGGGGGVWYGMVLQEMHYNFTKTIFFLGGYGVVLLKSWIRPYIGPPRSVPAEYYYYYCQSEIYQIKSTYQNVTIFTFVAMIAARMNNIINQQNNFICKT